MRAGTFNINDYLNKLNEEFEEKEKKEKEEAEKTPKKPGNSSTEMMDGGEGLTYSDGIIIPAENKKSYDWLKKEFQKGKTEVKVEMKMGGSNFEPGYDMQTDVKSVKDFKPGMFGEVKTADTEGNKGGKQNSAEIKSGTEKIPASSPKQNLDPKKNKSNFGKGEGETPKGTEKESSKPNFSKTNSKESDIKTKGKENAEEEKEETSDDKPKVKKIDLKTKK